MSALSAVQDFPDHLTPFISTQNPKLYTAIDHAGWRYILRVSRSFFKKNAHKKYLDGLKETGISTERIPLISEMDACLRKFGWRAVGVVGFIPPAIFMEFQSLGILPIACDMRKLEHLSYTPAPDIVHEAAGHAPIIADPEYARYLRSYGDVARRAIYSKKDMDVYHAVRMLSDIKEDPKSSKKDIAKAQKRLNEAVASVDYVSEATYLARMNWWTVEYGLVGDTSKPSIYGAGLLSSVGESYHCLTDEVKKIPLTLDCLNISYDITRPQPQLFVAKSFQTLIDVLEDFASTMAFRRGGIDGLSKAKLCEATTTTVLDSGIQMSGVLKNFMCDQSGHPAFLQFEGPTQLAFNDHEIDGQGPKHHKHGFSTPVGKLKGSQRTTSDLSEQELQKGEIHFESGIILTGIYKTRVTKNHNNKNINIIASFEDCTIKWGDQTLFKPEWGTFDLACGDQVVSVFGNAADRGKYMEATGQLKQKTPKQKTNATPKAKELDSLYQQVRKIREAGPISKKDALVLETISTKLDKKYSKDWLLRLEILELDHAHQLRLKSAKKIEAKLKQISKLDATTKELITRGLAEIQ